MIQSPTTATNHPSRSIQTTRGMISFPAYLPVTTFGQKYPLDDLIRPYLSRLAPAIMVSYYYAKMMVPEQHPGLPMWIDSGGFAALFEGSKICKKGDIGLLKITRNEEIETLHPKDILEFQESYADVALTLDFPIPPSLSLRESKRRQQLTIANAHWALANRRRKDMRLYACIQAWDVDSARACAEAYTGKGFDGVAIGGLVPRSQNPDLVLGIIRAVREVIKDMPLHVLGLGHPKFLQEIYNAGADSVDSSSYVQYAANGKLWASPDQQIKDPSPTDRLHLALCNLAMATGRSLPLSAAQLTFSTLRSVQCE